MSVRHEPCPDCGSSDSLAVYEDGGKFCFGRCQGDGIGLKEKGSESSTDTFSEQQPTKKSGKLVTNLDYVALPKRGNISVEICRKYGYALGEYKFLDKDTGEWEEQFCQIANYYNQNGQIVAQKLRTSDKEFKFVGSPSKTMLWGQHLWRNKGGRQLVITEGEIDCLSVAQAFEGKYPVVSISSGANSAKDAITANLEFIESFDKVIIWFDSDEAGQSALESIKGTISPSKMYYMPFDAQYKDANEVLKAKGEGTKGIINRLYEAIEYREDAIVRGSDMDFNEMRKPIRAGRPLPYPKLQEMTMGSRDAELWLWTAGSGIGKSTIVTEVAKFQMDNDHKVKMGLLYLEESNDKTYNRFMALDHNIPLKDLRLNPDLIDEEEAYQTHEKYFKNNRVAFYNHFGSVGTDKLLKKIRHMIISEGCDTIILDHISIAVSGLESDEGERKMLDVFMTDLRSLVEETRCTIHAIVHLKRVGGKNFNEGASVSLTDLRGSASLEQLSDAVISAERDQQGDNPYRCLIRVLKCRETGETGQADYIDYNKSTGRYTVAKDVDDSDYQTPDKGERKF